MRTGLLLRAALLACAAAAAFGAFAQQPAAPAQRVEIGMSPAERELVLERMRAMLAYSHLILDGTLRGDMQEVAKSARALGLGGGAHMPPELAPRLPAAFKQLAQQTHRTFDEIAAQAEAGGARDAILQRLAENLGRCVACHATYRLGVAP
jgi:hypothetical protein